MKLASDEQIKKRLIRLAYQQPGLRKDILPLVTATEKQAKIYMLKFETPREAQQELPAFYRALLKMVGPKIGKAIGKQYNEYLPTSEEAAADFAAFLASQGGVELEITFSVFNPVVLEHVKINQWVKWARDKRGGPYDGGNYAPNDVTAKIIAKVNYEFVQWMRSKQATLQVERQLVAGISAPNNIRVFMQQFNNKLKELVKANKDKIFALPPTPTPPRKPISPEIMFNPMLNPRFASDNKTAMAFSDQTYSNTVSVAMDTVTGILNREVANSVRANPATVPLQQLERAMNSAAAEDYKNEVISYVLPAARPMIRASFPLSAYFDFTKNKIIYTNSWMKALRTLIKVGGEEGAEKEFRANLIRLANEKKHLRPHLLPLLQEHK